MYKGFNLTISEESFAFWKNRGLLENSKNAVVVESQLSKFVDRDGKLSAGQIASNWFPSIKADVFISHSHADETIALGLAGWLTSTFGLNVFIDSTVWGYAGDLQRKIDDEYCLNPGRSTYNYEKRNKSTSHINIILSSALHNMIDSTECIIFLNTPNSISCQGYIQDEATDSPWIFSEISMTRLVRRKLSRERLVLRKSEAANEAYSEPVNIKYDLPLEHLIKIDKRILDRWGKMNNVQGTLSLDNLYDIAESQFL